MLSDYLYILHTAMMIYDYQYRAMLYGYLYMTHSHDVKWLFVQIKLSLHITYSPNVI